MWLGLSGDVVTGRNPVQTSPEKVQSAYQKYLYQYQVLNTDSENYLK